MKRRLLRLAVVLSSLLLLLSPSVALANGVGVTSRHGDKLTATIGEGGDEDAFAVELSEGGKLNVAVKAAKGGPLLPTIRVFHPDGTEADISGLLKKQGTPKVLMKKFIGEQTGIHRVLIGGGGTMGDYTAAFKAKNPKAYKEKGFTVPGGGLATFEFTAATDALATIVLRQKSGEELAGARLLAPDGTELAGPGEFTRKKTTLSVKKLQIVQGGFGRYVVELDGSAGEATVDVVVKAKLAKIPKRKETLPPEGTLSGLTPGTILQEDTGVTLDLTGANLLAGSTAVVSGDGVTVPQVTLNGTTAAVLTVDAATDAPFGARDVTLIPPPLLGEPVTLPGSLTVQAPDPAVTGATMSVVKQGDAAAVVEIEGTGLRDGGTIAISGDGLTVGAAEFVSPTMARTTVAVAIDATVGTRNVTWTQPASGGGASIVADDLVDVFYPDPLLTSVSQTTIRQEESGVVLTLTGNHFRTGGTVLANSGVTVSNPTFVSPTEFRVTLDVAADAAFGDRTVTYTQPADGGAASVDLAAAFAVQAPIPTVASASPNTILQEQSGVSVSLMGTGFRAGGTVDVSGTGVTVTSVDVVSSTEATVTVDTDEFAPVGLRDVTFNQPAGSGGGSAT
ncbi:MAG: hypothetical protein ACYS99_21110, partial [Planctomycetota bacterium]